MKKILIVSDSLVIGGLEKSLIDLCNNLDYSKYSVDLYLFNEGRQLVSKLNKNVNLLSDSPFYHWVYNSSIGASLLYLIKKGRIDFVVYRIYRFLKARMNITSFTGLDWFFQKKALLKIDEHYDIAMGYAEGTAGYFVAECVEADVKSAWIHTDIKKINTNIKLNRMTFGQVDYICTVSQNSKNSLLELYPEYHDKYRVFNLPSLFDFEEIERLAEQPNDMDSECIKILSVGRLVELKGFHLCVRACKLLLNDNYRVKWYIVGEGEYRSTIENVIRENNLENNFILLGNCSNPYSYIKSADICVQASSYEGFALVVCEEKHFNKPVVVTAIPSFLEMIEHRRNGIVVKRNATDIYMGVKEIIDDMHMGEIIGKTPINGKKSKEETIRDIEKIFMKEV